MLEEPLSAASGGGTATATATATGTMSFAMRPVSRARAPGGENVARECVDLPAYEAVPAATVRAGTMEM